MINRALPIAAAIFGSVGWAASATASSYEVTVTNLTSGIHFTPLIVAAHPGDVSMFQSGQPASTQLQAIAEGGDISGMASLLEGIGATVVTGDGLMAPGGSATFTVDTTGHSANAYLSIAGMLLPTNDGFLGLNSISLRNGSGTYNVPGYDAGTEGNDELVGSGAPFEAGFPAPPPIVASGTGTGGQGIDVPAEGFVHIHRNVIGDFDPNGGVSDINAAVHRWLNPVARVTVRAMDSSDGPGRVGSLSATTYSGTAVEIFWDPAPSADSFITSYEIRRDGELLDTRDARSYYDDGLNPGTSYTYDVTAVDAEGRRGSASSVTATTR
ncbi:MAG: spondin domain-containing protein [Gammaproteobacteria bacterium]|nr:spondin domain-containing protein [Gammaproteobacteria bacterium]